MHESVDYGNSSDIASICAELKAVQTGESTVPVESLEEDEGSLGEISHSSDLSQAEQVAVLQSEKPTMSDKEEEAVVQDEQVPVSAPKSKLKASGTTSPDKPSAQTETIRVKVDLLNKLMELTGEIVLGRNQLLRQFSEMEDKSNLVAMAHICLLYTSPSPRD